VSLWSVPSPPSTRSAPATFRSPAAAARTLVRAAVAPVSPLSLAPAAPRRLEWDGVGGGGGGGGVEDDALGSDDDDARRRERRRRHHRRRWRRRRERAAVGGTAAPAADGVWDERAATLPDLW
jgi:hypothetical protein